MSIKTIGIGITTYNRPEVYKTCVEQIIKFLPNEYNYKIVSVNDCSTLEYPEFNNITELRNHKNLGIAKSKNVCLEYLKNCDYVFLFDDDTFPVKDGWIEIFTKPSEKYNIHHMMFLDEHDANLYPINNIVDISEDESIAWYDKANGCLLFFTKEAIEHSRFNELYPKYGFEHIELSLNLVKQGLVKTIDHGFFVSPLYVSDYIFSSDLEHTNSATLVPEDFVIPVSTLTEFEKQHQIQLASPIYYQFFSDFLHNHFNTLNNT